MSIDAYKKKVWKYPAEPKLSVPVGGKPVLVAIQDEKLHIWFEFYFPDHNPLAFIDVEIEIYGTGHVVPEAREHIGSVIDGPFVWHVYMVQKELFNE